MSVRIGLVVAAGVLVAGCAGPMAGRGDGPGAPIDPDEIPDAEPRAETPSRWGNPESYVVDGRRYSVRDSAEGYVARGVASWYGRKFHGRRTSSGEPYDMYRMTAAHRSLPLPTYARVTNLDNGRSAIVRINDRGPFVDERLIDLSYAAAVKLGIVETGTAPVRVRALATAGGGPAGPAAGGDVRAAGAGTAPDAGASGGPDSHPREARAIPLGEPAAAGGFRRTGGPRDVFIQVGAFRHRDNARQLRARLAADDIGPVRIAPARAPSGERVYRVRIGPLRAEDERRAVLGRLERAGIAPVRLVGE